MTTTAELKTYRVVSAGTGHGAVTRLVTTIRAVDRYVRVGDDYCFYRGDVEVARAPRDRTILIFELEEAKE